MQHKKSKPKCRLIGGIIMDKRQLAFQNEQKDIAYLEHKIHMLTEVNSATMLEFLKVLKEYSTTTSKSYCQILQKTYEILAGGYRSLDDLYFYLKDKVKEIKNMPTGNYANLFKSLDNLTLTWTYAPKFDKNEIKDVIYNDPATIVFWKDGTKTVVKCQKDKGDTYNPELGLAMCIIKKLSGNKGNYNDVFNKWLPEGWK